METNRRTQGCSGFTLVEMMMVIGILAILTTYAVVDYRRDMPRRMLDRAVHQVTAHLRAARMKAVSENGSVQVSFSPLARQYAIWFDDDGDGTVDGGEEQAYSLTDIPNVTVAVTPTVGSFTSRGSLDSSVEHWVIQLAVTDAGSRAVHVMASGHVEAEQ